MEDKQGQPKDTSQPWSQKRPWLFTCHCALSAGFAYADPAFF